MISGCTTFFTNFPYYFKNDVGNVVVIIHHSTFIIGFSQLCYADVSSYYAMGEPVPGKFRQFTGGLTQVTAKKRPIHRIERAINRFDKHLTAQDLDAPNPEADTQNPEADTPI
jgi:hypothetical protein